MPDETQGQGGTPEAQGETPATEGATPQTVDFDTWLGSQDETVKGLIAQRIKGLSTALDDHKNQRKQLAEQLKAVKAEAGSEAAKQLSEMQSRLETESRRADFYQEAAAAGCRDLRLAWLAANADGLTVKQVQQQHPDLFAPRPATNAGHGASNANGGAQRDMNAFIRRAAGR